MHPHIYTNGHVCASILGKLSMAMPQLTKGNEWSPGL